MTIVKFNGNGNDNFINLKKSQLVKEHPGRAGRPL